MLVKKFPQTKQTFKDYWSGDIAKGAFNSEDGLFTSNFWTGKTTVFRSGGKKFYLKEANPIMIVKQNGKQIGYAHVNDFFSGGLGTNKIYKSVAEGKNKYDSGLFDTAVGTAVDGFVHYGPPSDDDRIVSHDATRFMLYYHCVRDTL